MKLLAIDVGNTRIKWGLHNAVQWLQRSHVETTRMSQLKHAWAGLAPEIVAISNVAGARLRGQLEACLPPAGKVLWIKSERAQCGVSNSYEDPSQLGCDRWAALIGARSLSASSLVVVNAGTALTADALRDDGVFLGGVIVPGLELMRRALAKNTADLDYRAGVFQPFPKTTGDAILSGAINALCGTIERLARFVENVESKRAQCIISGGNAALLAPYVNLAVTAVDNLVLEGLLAIASELNAPSRAQ